MSLSRRQFSEYIIKPTLELMEVYSPAASALLLGTAVVESRLCYIRQLAGGPALGVYQMEPATHDDIYKNFLHHQPGLEYQVRRHTVTASAEEMVWNLAYATAMCRMLYYRFAESLPDAKDYEGLARYHKKYYNTEAGATDVVESTKIFWEIVQ